MNTDFDYECVCRKKTSDYNRAMKYDQIENLEI